MDSQDSSQLRRVFAEILEKVITIILIFRIEILESFRLALYTKQVSKRF
jgi:hypothetical protein